MFTPVTYRFCASIFCRGTCIAPVPSTFWHHSGLSWPALVFFWRELAKIYTCVGFILACRGPPWYSSGVSWRRSTPVLASFWPVVARLSIHLALVGEDLVPVLAPFRPVVAFLGIGVGPDWAFLIRLGVFRPVRGNNFRHPCWS